jgi:tetratricopeptide (TPR) repeat protein
MGFQGQLSSVSLTDIFQTLHMNRQTGTMSVASPDGVRHIYFDGGQIALVDAPSINGQAFLLNALLKKGLLSPEQASDLNQRLHSLGQPLRDLILASGYIQENELDDVSAWCIEEQVCPIFEWSEGDFTFTDGAPIAQLQGPDVVAMGRVGLQTTQLLLEATRRKDEWRRIREVITDSNALYIVDHDGRNNLRAIETDPEMLKVLRYLDGRHRLDHVADAVGVTRFDTYAITAQLILAGVARARTAQEVVVDAEELRAKGDIEGAMHLLESIYKENPVPEILRPLAECFTQLKQGPRAVELYLELIQFAQDQGNLEQARADLDTVLALSPDDPDLQFDRAKVLAELGAIDDAANAYVAAAQAYINTRDTGRAIDACHRAKNLLPRSPDPHRFLAKAYLMDGQTENALIEYKSLWHALLSSNRPKTALDNLKKVLESDCRFNNIKEQVLGHAQNSEAIKTSKAARGLIYLVMGFVLAGASVAGYQWYKTVLREDTARQAFDRIKASSSEKERSGQYQALFDELNSLRTDYGGTHIIVDVDTLHAQIKDSYEARASEQAQTARALQAAGQHQKATATLNLLRVQFPGTKAAEQANALLAEVSDDQITLMVQAAMEETRRKWGALQWDEAISELHTIIQRADLPTKLRGELTALHGDWTTRAETAKDLYDRAEQLEKSGRKQEAILAYKRASGGKGELYASKARDYVAKLELEFAQETGQSALHAFERRDEKAMFAALDALAQQVKNASSKGVADYVVKFAIPCVVSVDSPLTSLIIKRAGNEQIISPAPNASAAWSHTFTYAPNEKVTVEARRPGFTTQTVLISYALRRMQVQIALQRGPLWLCDLNGGIGNTQPIIFNKSILLTTNRATIDVIDTSVGSSRPITFSQTVDEFKHAPFLVGNMIYAVLDHRLSAINGVTRAVDWTYPSGMGDSNLRLLGQVVAQEHQLIPGQTLFFLPHAGGEIITFARDNDNRLIAYPKITVGNDITGQAYIHQNDAGHTVLYVPNGSRLSAFDTTAVTERSAATPLYQQRTRGEMIGRIISARVANKPALLCLDNSGLLVGFDANPDVSESQRMLGSWALDGTGIDRAAYHTALPIAYVTTAEGRVVAADLQRSGQLLWRFPAQGKPTPYGHAPVIGKLGVYVADLQGTLRCLDAQTGKERWRADLGSPPAAGLLALDGRVYIPTRSGHLVCFEEGNE